MLVLVVVVVVAVVVDVFVRKDGHGWTLLVVTTRPCWFVLVKDDVVRSRRPRPRCCVRPISATTEGPLRKAVVVTAREHAANTTTRSRRRLFEKRAVYLVILIAAL
jgi:hypothetical protein